MRGKNKPYNYPRAWNYALWLLSQRMYTSQQIRDKLKVKDVETEVLERVMSRLAELNFTDDEAYAQAYVRSRQTQKGPIALRQELFRKGLDETLVTKTLETLDNDSQLETACNLLIRNKWRLSKADSRKNYAKAYAFLARRGFGSDVVKRAIERSGVLETAELDD